jgi:MFS family permease
MIRNIKAITASCYVAMFFLGVSASLVGAAARNIGLSPYQIGLLIAAQQVGFLLSVSISGALSDTHQKPKILFVGSLILGIALLTFYWSELFWANLVIMFLIGVGIATYEGVTDPLLLDIHKERQSLHINVNHFFVTLGAILITLYLLFLQMNWRQSVVQSGIVVLLLAVFFGLTRVEAKQGRIEPFLERLQTLRRERTLVALFLATALVVGVEIGSLSILTTFLMDLRGFDQVTSKIGLLVFLCGMATGRVVLGLFTRKRQIPQYILALFGLASLVYTGLFFLRLDGLSSCSLWSGVPGLYRAVLSKSRWIELRRHFSSRDFPLCNPTANNYLGRFALRRDSWHGLRINQGSCWSWRHPASPAYVSRRQVGIFSGVIASVSACACVGLSDSPPRDAALSVN